MSDYAKAEILVNEFGEYCRELVRFHIPDYQFSWNQNKRRFGVCRYSKKTVELSVLNFLLNPHTGNDTIRHEVAHALAKEIGGKHHDYTWQIEAIKIGATPKACVTGEIQTFAKYELFCNNCGMSYKRHKSTKKEWFCHRCRTKLIFRRRENNHNLVIPTMEELNLPAVDATFPVIFAEEKPKKETLRTVFGNLGLSLNNSAS